ncbi:MAG: PocR ligand-binding domain-containing protein [Candidatus Omnitrophota bacterium]
MSGHTHNFKRRLLFYPPPSLYPKIWHDVLKSTPLSVKFCRDCAQKALNNNGSNFKDGYQCPLGVYGFMIPVKVKEEVVAFLNLDPVILDKPKDLSASVESACKLGIDPVRFIDALREVKNFTFYGMHSVIELLYGISQCIFEAGYQNKKLKDLAPSSDKVFGHLHLYYKNKLLTALLEVSYNFFNADRASIMLFDEKSNELYIRMAKGLSEDTVKTARVKIGQGLSGMAAESIEPIFIDEYTDIKTLKAHMREPRLKNSLIVPIKIKDKLFGVLNIGSFKSDPAKFTPQSLEIINKLNDLVETTLIGLPYSI